MAERAINKRKELLNLLRLNPYVLGGEGLKGIALSVPWDILIPRHIDGAGKVAVVDMESKWWVVRMLADIRRESP